MKNINEYIIEKKTTGSGCVEMVKSIIDQLKNYPKCKYDFDKDEWSGENADVWNSASQFLRHYVDELNQSDLKKIVDAMGWKKWIPDVNDIDELEIPMCLALELQN